MMDTDSRDALEFLLSPGAHPGATGPISLIETHMSWVVLAGERVLKLKKPVRTAWVDFTSVAARERNAREELRLNRRLAPQVYLGLLALRRDQGRLTLLPAADAPDDGRTLDWLVCMRRLPANRMLDRMIAEGSVGRGDIDALIDVLVAFYADAPRSDMPADAYIAHLAREQAGNRDVLLLPQFALAEAPSLLDAHDAALAANTPALRERVLQRRLVEGHGDLRPEHVCLLRPPVVIDALEFSAELRHVDPLDEWVFLGLECTLAGAPWIAQQVLVRCAAALHDPAPIALQWFYAAGRALLRARLCAAHLLDDPARTPQKWLGRTHAYLAHAAQAMAAQPLSAAMPRGSL